jgi:hypothetical protein
MARKLRAPAAAALAPAAAALVAALGLLGTKRNFVVGDLVDWKPGLRNRGPGAPYLVAELLPKPIVEHTADIFHSNFREPLDCVVLYSHQPVQMIDGAPQPSGPPVIHSMLVDSRRLELAKG